MNIDQFQAKKRKYTLSRMQKELKQLRRFTKDCREDMHEPDEQDITANVIGDHLDNAMGATIEPLGQYQEFVIILHKGKGKELVVNVADLIALARKAVIV